MDNSRRGLSTLTKEEIMEFFNAIDIGEYEIKKFKYIKSKETFEVSVTTEWYSKDENGTEDVIKIEDLWEFTLDGFETEDTIDSDYSWLYQEFLLAKGFKENRFKCV